MTFIKALSLAVASVALILPATGHARTDLSSRLSPLIQGTDVPAAAVLIIRNAEVAGEGVAGVRDLESRDLARAGDVWHIGSDGKAITATMIARLVEQGVLSWDATLAEMLPSLADEMLPAYRQATLQDLLSHRAGLVDIIGLDETLAYFEDTRPLPEQRLEYVRRALVMPMAVEPRTASTYSNTGYVLAGVIAEQATGKPTEDLVRELVLQPLGMTTAAFGATAKGQPLGHEGTKPLTGLMADNPAVLAPAGELHMSLQDWARFVIDQMKGERGQGALLTQANYVRLHTPQGETRAALGWGTPVAFKGKEGRYISHVGSNGYWRALVLARLDNQSAILTVVNCADGCQAETVNRETLNTFAGDILQD